MNVFRPLSSLGVVAALSIGGCSGRDNTPAADSAMRATSAVGAAMAAVEILAPANGDTIALPFVLRLGIAGAEVIPANGKREAGKGHHHFIIDGDPATSDTLPLAAAPTVIHMGNGASERTLDSLPPGPHRVIAIFASGDHVPWSTVARDTVSFVVKRK